jgi:hypothetical protein
MINKPIPKPSPLEKESKPGDHLAYNMDILKTMVNRCDYLYAQKTADISRGLERNFTEGSISLALYQRYNNEIEKLVTEFGEKCSCLKATKLIDLEKQSPFR